MSIDRSNAKKVVGKLSGVTFLYVKMQTGNLAYKSTTDREYAVDCAVDKATAKEFKKTFPKNSCKEYDNADFTAKFKIDPPFPNQEEQFVIALRADAQMKKDFAKENLRAGDDIPYGWSSRPKVFVPVEGGVKDITMSTLVANGSVGDAGFSLMQTTFGEFPQLAGILVTDLIEYVAEGGSGSLFGTVVGGLNAGNGAPQQMYTAGAPTPTPEDEKQEDETPPADKKKIPF